MKRNIYRVVADKNWHISDEEWMKKGIYLEYFNGRRSYISVHFAEGI